MSRVGNLNHFYDIKSIADEDYQENQSREADHGGSNGLSPRRLKRKRSRLLQMLRKYPRMALVRRQQKHYERVCLQWKRWQ